MPFLTPNHKKKVEKLEMAEVTPNFSEQDLIRSGGDETSNGSRSNKITKTQIATVTILCFVNLINYMDRYTIAGMAVFNLQYPGLDM